MNAKSQGRSQADIAAVCLAVIRKATTPLTAIAIKKAVVPLGVKKAEIDDKWDALQKKLVEHPHVTRPTDRTYAWSDEPISGSDALDRILRLPKPIPSWIQTELVSVIKDEIAGSRLESKLFVDRSHQRLVDNARVFAEIASLIEELAAAGETAAQLVKRVRSKANDYRAEPIGRTDQSLEFDPRSHASSGAAIAAGMRAVVIRPGYRLMDAAGGDLIRHAQVKPA